MPDATIPINPLARGDVVSQKDQREKSREGVSLDIQVQVRAKSPQIKRCDVGRGSNPRCPAGTPLTDKMLDEKAV